MFHRSTVSPFPHFLQLAPNQTRPENGGAGKASGKCSKNMGSAPQPLSKLRCDSPSAVRVAEIWCLPSLSPLPSHATRAAHPSCFWTCLTSAQATTTHLALRSLAVHRKRFPLVGSKAWRVLRRDHLATGPTAPWIKPVHTRPMPTLPRLTAPPAALTPPLAHDPLALLRPRQ